MKKTTVAIILIACLLAAAAAYAVNEYFKLPTSGYVETEYGLTFDPSSIDWGPNNLRIGTPVSRLVTLTNTGTRNFTNINFTETDFSGGILTYWIESNVTGTSLAIGESVIANFTLIIHEATQGSFSFDINVYDQS